MTDEPSLTREEARDLLAPYALGALPREDAAAVERALASWPEGRAALAELLATVDAFALLPGEEAQPPLSLEGRVIAAARRERAATPVFMRRLRPRPWWTRFAPHALAASFAVLAVVFGVFWLSDDDPVQGRWVELTPEAAETGGTAYIVNPGPEPRAVFVLGLAAPPAGERYFVWVLLADGTVAGLDGLPTVGASGLPGLWVPPTFASAVQGFAVTLEPADEERPETPQRAEVLFTFPSE